MVGTNWRKAIILHWAAESVQTRWLCSDVTLILESGGVESWYAKIHSWHRSQAMKETDVTLWSSTWDAGLRQRYLTTWKCNSEQGIVAETMLTSKRVQSFVMILGVQWTQNCAPPSTQAQTCSTTKWSAEARTKNVASSRVCDMLTENSVLIWTWFLNLEAGWAEILAEH